MEFRLTRHFMFPLRTHDALAQHDPIAFITGSLIKPEQDELFVFQMVLAPARSREATSVYGKLLVGKEIDTTKLSWTLPLKLIGTMFDVFTLIMHGIGGMFLSSYPMPARPKATVPVTKAQQDLIDSRLVKLGQPLFYADMRVAIVAASKQRARERAIGFTGSLASFTNPGFQALTAKQTWLLNLIPLWRRFSWIKFIHGLPSARASNACLLSAEEVANLYHFPYGEMMRAENVITSSSRTLAAPVAVKRAADSNSFDVELGMNHHHGSQTAIGLTAAERERHMYIIGGTGNGKTTMLEYAIVQDILNGKGVAIIDPHGDSAKRLLGYIPESRVNDVVYLNPRDLDHPIGLNLLELPQGLSGSDLAHEKDLVAEAVISVLSKVFDNDSGGNAYRIERVLRNAIHTAFTVEDPTLFTVLRLLTDSAFRKQVTHRLADDSLKRFWKEELGKAGEFQRVKISGGPIARIERYERSEAAKRMLGQAKSTINFEDIVNQGKILICNFSKGSLGEDTSILFGATVLAKLQLAAWRRDAIAATARKPFYLYVDEFQNFASESFMGLFSEARKYKLFVTIAQQSVAQLHDQDMLNTILDNVGTVVAFRSKSPETERILLHQFAPHVDAGEIGNLPSYNFYIKIDAVQPQEPTSGETIVLANNDSSDAVMQRVIEASRRNYGVTSTGSTTQINGTAERQRVSVKQPKQPVQAGLPSYDGDKTYSKEK